VPSPIACSSLEELAVRATVTDWQRSRWRRIVPARRRIPTVPRDRRAFSLLRSSGVVPVSDATDAVESPRAFARSGFRRHRDLARVASSDVTGRTTASAESRDPCARADVRAAVGDPGGFARDEPVSIEDVTRARRPRVVRRCAAALRADSGLPDSLLREHEEVVIAHCPDSHGLARQPVSPAFCKRRSVRHPAACVRGVRACDQRDLELLCSTVRPREKGAELDPVLSQNWTIVAGIRCRRNRVVLDPRCLRSTVGHAQGALPLARRHRFGAGLDELRPESRLPRRGSAPLV